MNDNGERRRWSGASRWLKSSYQASTIGFTLVLATVFGFGIGLGLDRLFHTGFDNELQVGWFTLGFTLLGIIAGFREMMRTVIRLSEDADTNADSPRDTSGDDGDDV
jgi:F0F1-type ATP synthase assembly protein I